LDTKLKHRHRQQASIEQKKREQVKLSTTQTRVFVDPSKLAKCIDGVGSFVCICPPGVFGPRCEHNPDECSPNPCANGGTCRDGVNSFSCDCPAGLTGSTCQTVSTNFNPQTNPSAVPTPREGTTNSSLLFAPVAASDGGDSSMMSWGKYFFPILFAILALIALLGWKLGWWAALAKLGKAKPPSHLKAKQDPPGLSRAKSAGERTKKRIDSLADDGADLSPKAVASSSPKHAGVNVFFEGRSRSGHDLARDGPEEPIDYEQAKRDAIGASRDPTEIKIDDPHRPRDVFPAQRSRADEALPSVPEL
jgi:hypothetical protein